MNNIFILDIGLGNVKSIANAFSVLGHTTTLSCDKQALLNSAQGLVIPGVGAFSEGMKRIAQRDLIDTIITFANSGRPTLGICLGMQMLFDGSDEFGYCQGLGLIPGQVQKLPLPKGSKLPNIGWGRLKPNKAYKGSNSIVSEDIASQPFYFVHSYAAKPKDNSHTATYSDYCGVDFCSTVNNNNIWGCQYHPEKSGPNGLQLLKRFAQQVVK
ncbi:imidazole glycerol phosphate synthase subunit HisH [Alteromonas sediminis]|uniref:imidazole glycerol phosphate synthase subunit HisH n=1 Tax=Alteromonas sediminis TaxID=2259342 RepID=UPI001405610E|nr:imidazole glycerol phosphate synthase subunit HisH [Alteromonas sediminis]